VNALRHPALHLLLRLGIGGYFLYACADKILDPAAFARIVYQWQAAGPVLSNVVAVLLPWVELVAGLLLVAGIWKREAAAATGLMLSIFIVAATSVLLRGIDVQNCGCTSTSADAVRHWWEGVGWFLLTRNSVMLAGCTLLATVDPRPFRSRPPA
jgi:uncharacterized membrane protein YphA (DoxX/SURF4 family)